MPSPVETAVDTYIRLIGERDSSVREQMIKACFADDARMVTRGREIRGHAALVSEIAKFVSDPRLLRVRMLSRVDAGATIFRYGAVAEFRDGTTAEAFDSGEIDANGRISLLLAFTGPLPPVEEERVVLDLTS